MEKPVPHSSLLSILFTPVLAALFTAATYGLVLLFFRQGTYTYTLFMERSWIQHASTFCFWAAMVTLFLKHRKFTREKEAYRTGLGLLEKKAHSETTLIWSDADRIGGEFKEEKYGKSITFNRILHGLDRLRKTQSTDAFGEYFRTRSDIDSGELESSYAGIRYLIWLIPTLGFIGTVMGISLGIQGFSDIIAKSQDFNEIRKSLPSVTYYLGTAFDTTFLALALSVLAVFYMSFLLKKEEQLLEQIDNLCFDELIPLFQEHSRDADKIVHHLGQQTEQIINNANGNRASLENTLRKLPALVKQEHQELLKNLFEQLKTIVQNTRPKPSDEATLAQDTIDPQEVMEALREVSGSLRKLEHLCGLPEVLQENNHLLRTLGDIFALLQSSFPAGGERSNKNETV